MVAWDRRHHHHRHHHRCGLEEGAVVEIIIIMELFDWGEITGAGPTRLLAEMRRGWGGGCSRPACLLRPAPWGRGGGGGGGSSRRRYSCFCCCCCRLTGGSRQADRPSSRRLRKGKDLYDDGVSTEILRTLQNCSQTDGERATGSHSVVVSVSQSHVAGLTVVTGNWLSVLLLLFLIVATSSSYSYSSSSSTMIRSSV